MMQSEIDNVRRVKLLMDKKPHAEYEAMKQRGNKAQGQKELHKSSDYSRQYTKVNEAHSMHLPK